MDTPSISFLGKLKIDKASRYFVILTCLLSIGYYLLETVNGRAQMADFRVYYDAANAFIHNTQLYGKAFGVSSGFYKYSPFACMPFIPLAILPYGVASLIYYLIITWSICWFIISLMNDREILGMNLKSKTGLALFMIALFMADHFERELHLGNVNLFLLIMAYIIYRALRQDNFIVSGILMGILLLFKPHFLILIPYFLWRKKWRMLLITLTSILVGILLPALIKGYEGNIQLHAEWLMAMRDHNMKLEDSPNTVYGIVNHFILNHRGGLVMVGSLLAAIAGLFLFLIIDNQRKLGNDQIRFIEFFVLISLIPNLTHTDTEHFMWSLPLIVFVIVSLLKRSLTMKPIYIVAMSLAFIPYCLNSPDIVGKKISFLFDEGGLLGLANIFIISISLMIWIQTREMNHSTKSA